MSTDSEKLWTSEEVMELVDEMIEAAETEIEDAALEAAKLTLEQVGPELAYEQSMHEQWEAEARRLEAEKKTLYIDLEEEKNHRIWWRNTALAEGSAIITLLMMIALVWIF